MTTTTTLDTDTDTGTNTNTDTDTDTDAGRMTVPIETRSALGPIPPASGSEVKPGHSAVPLRRGSPTRQKGKINANAVETIRLARHPFGAAGQ